MAGSLQDQFLRAGLVNQKQAKKVRHESRKAKKKGAPGATKASADTSLDAERRAKAERDRLLNQQRDEARRARDLEAQAKQLVERHRIALDDDGRPFSFPDGDVVRTLSVSDLMRARLVSGEVAIVAFGTEFEIVPAQIAARLETRDPSCIRCWNRPESSSRGKPDADDPYAEYVVPDDLVW